MRRDGWQQDGGQEHEWRDGEPWEDARPVTVVHDGSPDSAAALRLASLDAARTGSDVHVVVVPGAPGTDALALGALLDSAREVIAEAAPAAGTVLSAAPGPVVPAVLAATRGARLLAVGARGPGQEWSATWGGVALELSRLSPVPVLVARAGSVLLEQDADAAPEVLAALAGDAGDAVVLRTAAALARRGGGRLHLVRTERGAAPEVGTAATGDDPGGRLPFATPAEALTHAVARADVVVCEADEGVALEHLLPTATVHTLAVRMARPVLTVPPGPPAQVRGGALVGAAPPR
ncbi:universal stress protein [Paenibacillus sp. TRM 82003]|uniref:universal stress protein n=1 Tax=Kineococcus sp. TRM81007 TaxID=2925831 RepID=UPI001F56B5FE|nr:universal stress protein [Kineococcus sp. TRM81007]MCI2239031.1 universal stress protein [Kineococcus sp. TRM81007]MCI3924451.1 universal stress protein [Paenibacillus sp. TRM 82003]